ncbi:DUF3817 domain-containing protein [Sediminihabitans luteus]|uniref:DUF3817 domain-containing protein n=1 Tax=Sediminihabitans luteus TaxID=1138585 RepID=UPI001EF2891D|nr:DUF3817 domain-containing protein [Sediminihabitans luteus]
MTTEPHAPTPALDATTANGAVPTDGVASLDNAQAPARDRSLLVRTFHVVAIAEAVSWAGLLVGMFFKWILETTEVGVSVMGPVHGAMFMFYALLAVLVAVRLRWSVGTTLLALVAAVPPFCTLVFDVWARRTGRFARRERR